MIFGGEEWWFYNHRIRAGDLLTQERCFIDYKESQTSFAGPMPFQRGETVHRSQDGTLVAKERSTAIRYLVSEPDKRRMYAQQLPPKPRWTQEELVDLESIRHNWILSNREGTSPSYEQVQIGDRLPRRAHSITSFTTEYRAFRENIWGELRWVAPEGVEDPWIQQDPGYVDGSFNRGLVKEDSGHVFWIYDCGIVVGIVVEVISA